MGVRAILWLSCALFSIGVYGMLTRRHAIAMLLSLELILNASAINFVLFSRLFSHVGSQAFALFVIALAACESVVGLALVLFMARSANTVYADKMNILKG